MGGGGVNDDNQQRQTLEKGSGAEAELLKLRRQRALPVATLNTEHSLTWEHQYRLQEAAQQIRGKRASRVEMFNGVTATKWTQGHAAKTETRNV